MATHHFSVIEVEGEKPAWKILEDGEAEFKYWVEPAPSSMARCQRGCGELIKKGSLRIGEPLKDPRGDYGAISGWRHLTCTRLKPGQTCEMSEVYGFDKLSKEQQKAVKDELSRTDVPEHLKAIDPEDPAFLPAPKLPRVKAPDSIALDLLPYQEEGYGWMVEQERDESRRGGILADEMGMGKTLQTICLICHEDRSSKPKNKAGVKRKAPTCGPAEALLHGPTLVVCPSSALWQWHDEILRSTKEGTLKPFVYYGGNRSKALTAETLRDYDVILTTYPVLEYEYRHQVDGQKVRCEFCDKAMLPRKLELHYRYFCGPYAKRTEKLSKTERKQEGQSQETMKKGMKTLGIIQTDQAVGSPSSGTTSAPTTSSSKKRTPRPRGKSAYMIWKIEHSRALKGEGKEVPEAGELKELWGKLEKTEQQRYEDLSAQSKQEAEQRAAELDAIEASQEGKEGLESVNQSEQKQGKGKKGGKRTSNVPTPSNIYRELMASAKREGEIIGMYSPGSKKQQDAKQDGEEEADQTTKTPKKPRALRELEDTLTATVDASEDTTPMSGRKRRAARKEPSPPKVVKLTKHKRKSTESTSSEKKKKKDLKKRGAADDSDEDEDFEPTPSSSSSESEDAKSNDGGDGSDSDAEEDDEVDGMNSAERREHARRKAISALVAKAVDARDRHAETLRRRRRRERRRQRAFEESSESDFEDDTSPAKTTKKASNGAKKKKKKSKAVSPSPGKGGGKKSALVPSSSAKNKKVSPSSSRRRASSTSNGNGGGDPSSSSEEEEDDGSDSEEEGFVVKGLICDPDGVDLRSSFLHCVSWTRVVLDEAHKIKGRTNSTGKSASALSASKRWCLTGTPIQNRVAELFGIIRFLQHDPYAYYVCRTKGCECKKLDWQFGARGDRCVDCKHSPMMHSALFNQEILNPITKCGYAGAGARAMLKLRTNLLNPLMLRRTKVDRAKDLNLPPLQVNMVEIELDEEERDFYECVYKRTQANFNKYVHKGTVLNNYAHIFELLSRLRQTLDHPYLVLHGPNADSVAAKASVSSGNSDVCGICNLDILDAKDMAVAACRHSFHKECIVDHIEMAKDLEGDEGQAACPTCFQPMTLTLDIRGVSDDEDDSSPKKRKPKKAGGPKKQAPPTAVSTVKTGTECRACFDRQRDALYLPCGHVVLCMECTAKMTNKQCPLCRQKIDRVVRTQSGGGEDRNVTVARDSIIQRVDTSRWQSSSKIEALVKALVEMRRKDPTAKAIVFSQYRTMIDLVEWRLKQADINPVKLMGYMPLAERRSVLQAFKTKDSIQVILMSLKAGGEGLNLQEANYVFLLEPWWNPAVEMQAVHRAYRIGQKKPVFATRFITKDSIEDKMFQLQQKKQLVFEGCVDAKQTALAKLTQEDLAFLFHT